jgi:hypothetical protein
MEHMAIFSCNLETMFAIEAQGATSTPPSTSVTTNVILVA